MKKTLRFILILSLLALLQSCATTTKKIGSVHGDKPLIDTKKIINDGQKEMDQKVVDGPKPYDTEFTIRPDKRKVITTTTVKNYVSISDEYSNLKQNISINFQGMDFKYVMSLMADIAGINILVGDEVSGTVNARIDNVGWDKAFQTLSTATMVYNNNNDGNLQNNNNNIVPYEIVLSLSYSKSLHSFVRNSWLPMLESTSKVSSVEKLLNIVYPPGSELRVIKKYNQMQQIEDAYIKLKEKLQKSISDSVEDRLISLFATIDRDVDRTYGKTGKQIIVHDDEDEVSFWQQQNFSIDDDNLVGSTLNVEQMVSAALGDINLDDNNNNSTGNNNNKNTLKIRRASEDDGLLKKDSEILAAKERTKNVLRVFVLANERVSYVQGMNFIVRSFLKMSNNNESKAFAFLLSLFEFYGYDEIAANDLGRLKVCLFQLESLIRLNLPVLHEHFVEENVDTMMYASGWFMTLFTRNDVLSPTLSLQVLKHFFLFGWPILFKVSLAILCALERMLLSRDFESMVKFLQNSRSKISKEYPTPKELFNKANEFNVTSKQLLRFEELYKQRK